MKISELIKLADAVKGWSNNNQAWLDHSEDVSAAVVGHINEDGETYPVATIDCDQYYAGGDSLPLAKFYAAANPATVKRMAELLVQCREALEGYVNVCRSYNDPTDFTPVVLDEGGYARDALAALDAFEKEQ